MNIRLSKFQIKTIKDIVEKNLGKEVDIYIFGSRADLTKRGGDIDILVKTNKVLNAHEKFILKKRIIIEFYKKLGVRKIDLIIINEPQSIIEEIAVEQGIRI